MGTAILFPQDFLTPQSRSKLQSPGPTYPFKPPSVSKRNRANFAQASDIGWLPVPADAEISSPLYGDVNRTKAQKAFHWNNSSSNPLASDLYPHQFSERRRQEGSVTDSLAHFASPGSLGLLKDGKKWQMEGSTHVDAQSERTGGQNKVVGTDGDAFEMNSNAGAGFASDIDVYGHSAPALFLMGKSGLFWVYRGAPGSAGLGLKDFGSAAAKHSGVNALHENWNASTEEKAISVQSAAKPTMANVVGRNDMCLTKHHTRGQDKFSSKGFVQLRRTMTEYPLAQRAHGQYTKLCKERWAGPAYSSSPHPSSLPLPKFCLPHMKSSYVDSPPFMKQHSACLHTKFGPQPSANTSIASDENGGIWDAAFATKDLRRLLNLDS